MIGCADMFEPYSASTLVPGAYANTFLTKHYSAHATHMLTTGRTPADRRAVGILARHSNSIAMSAHDRIGAVVSMLCGEMTPDSVILNKHHDDGIRVAER